MKNINLQAFKELSNYKQQKYVTELLGNIRDTRSIPYYLDGEEKKIMLDVISRHEGMRSDHAHKKSENVHKIFVKKNIQFYRLKVKNLKYAYSFHLLYTDGFIDDVSYKACFSPRLLKEKTIHKKKILMSFDNKRKQSEYQERDKLLVVISKEGHFGKGAKKKPIKYCQYLGRKIWKNIRKRVYHKYEYQCQRCASYLEDLPDCLNVHHKKYTRENLLGSSLDGLLLLCKWCHYTVEFDTSGPVKRKRTLEEANKIALEFAEPPRGLQDERDKDNLVSINLINILRDQRLGKIRTLKEVEELKKILVSQIEQAEDIISNGKIVFIDCLWPKKKKSSRKPRQKKQNKKKHKRKKKAKRKAYRGSSTSVPHGAPEVKPPESEEKCKKCGKNPIIDKHKQYCNECISKEMVWGT